MSYYYKYLKYKNKYLKLKQTGGLKSSPSNLNETRPVTRLYEEKFLEKCGYLKNYDYPYVKIGSKPSDDILNRIEQFHLNNRYQRQGFEQLVNLGRDLELDNLPNNTVFTYILFPVENTSGRYGFDTDVDIRFHRVDSVFEFNSKHDYIIEKYAMEKGLDKNDQLVYCGGELVLYKNIDNEIVIKVNRQSGTVPSCWEADVSINQLFYTKTGIKTEELKKSMLDSTSNYDVFHEDFDYLNNLVKLGLDLKFYKNCNEENFVTINQIQLLEKKDLFTTSPKKELKRYGPPPVMRSKKRSRRRGNENMNINNNLF